MPSLEADGWELESAEERHAAARDTFHIPARHEREAVSRGTWVKLLFLFAVEKDGEPLVACERMWVVVEGSHAPGRYAGELQSQPTNPTRLKAGARIEFGPEHIAAILVDDEPRGLSYWLRSLWTLVRGAPYPRPAQVCPNCNASHPSASQACPAGERRG